MDAVAGTAIGRERRRHGRWSVSGAYAAIQKNRKLPIVDISIGGFLARLPDDGREVGSLLEGTIYWRGDRERIEFPFRADIVRRLDSGEKVAAQFQELEGESIDNLLRFLSAVEAERHERIEREQRAAERRILLRKLLVRSVIGLSICAGLYFAWLFGFSS